MINKKLKELNVDGEIIYYKYSCDAHEECSWEWTDFYRTNDKSKSFKLFWWCGPIITYFTNRVAFKLDYDIESCRYSKDQVKKDVVEKMGASQKLKDRCDEIKSGNII